MFIEIRPKKAFYKGEYVGIALGCNGGYTLVKLCGTTFPFDAWRGFENDFIPKKYQTKDYYWYYRSNRLELKTSFDAYGVE